MKLGDAVLERADELAQLEARDTGKSLRTAKADVMALARYFEYYGGAADKLQGETLEYETGYMVVTLREPHGVTGHIIPWNYPMQIFGRSVGGPGGGNACVINLPKMPVFLRFISLNWPPRWVFLRGRQW